MLRSRQESDDPLAGLTQGGYLSAHQLRLTNPLAAGRGNSEMLPDFCDDMWARHLVFGLDGHDVSANLHLDEPGMQLASGFPGLKIRMPECLRNAAIIASQ